MIKRWTYSYAETFFLKNYDSGERTAAFNSEILFSKSFYLNTGQVVY